MTILCAQAELIDRLRADNARLHGLSPSPSARSQQAPPPFTAATGGGGGARGGGGVGGGGEAGRPETVALVQWLDDVGLGRYADGLVSEGFDELQLLLGPPAAAELTTAAVGMRRGDSARLALRLAELQAGWLRTPPPPPPSPPAQAAAPAAAPAAPPPQPPLLAVETAGSTGSAGSAGWVEVTEPENWTVPAGGGPVRMDGELAGLVGEGVLTAAELAELLSA